MNCLGCEGCATGPIVTTHDGRQVCNFCPDWKLECEARQVLSDFPDKAVIKSRRVVKMSKANYLLEVRNARGENAYQALRDMMMTLHNKGIREGVPNKVEQ